VRGRVLQYLYCSTDFVQCLSPDMAGQHLFSGLILSEPVSIKPREVQAILVEDIYI
jgi:hypothetical protein